MTVADYGRWRSIRDVAISDDGVWASYAYQQRRVDDTLFVRNLTSGAEQKIPRASRAQFADDSRWIAYFVAEPVKPNDQQPTDTPQNAPAKVELRDLTTGTTVSWSNVASFAFSKGSNALIVRKARPGAAPDAAAGRGGAGAPSGVAGTDMILHHLHDGSDDLIGIVTASTGAAAQPVTIMGGGAGIGTPMNGGARGAGAPGGGAPPAGPPVPEDRSGVLVGFDGDPERELREQQVVFAKSH